MPALWPARAMRLGLVACPRVDPLALPLLSQLLQALPRFSGLSADVRWLLSGHCLPVSYPTTYQDRWGLSSTGFDYPEPHRDCLLLARA